MNFGCTPKNSSKILEKKIIEQEISTEKSKNDFPWYLISKEVSFDNRSKKFPSG